MTNFAQDLSAPRSMTEQEFRAVLRKAGEHRSGLRDLCIMMLAGTSGLREHEILALDQSDLFDERGVCRQVIQLRVFKGRALAERRGRVRRDQQVRLSTGTREKLTALRRCMQRDGFCIWPSSPMFQSRLKQRLSARSVRDMFAHWQEAAGIENKYSFHDLRHTAISAAYRLSKRDPVAAAKFARHSNLRQIMRYVHPTEEEMVALVEKMPWV